MKKHNLKKEIKKHHYFIYYGSLIGIILLLILSFIPFFDVLKPEIQFVNKTIINSFEEPYMVEEFYIEYLDIENKTVPIQKTKKYTKFKNITETMIVPEPYEIQVPGQTNIWGLLIYKEVK